MTPDDFLGHNPSRLDIALLRKLLHGLLGLLGGSVKLGGALMSEESNGRGGASNLPHLPFEDSLFRAQLGLPCAYLLFWSRSIEEPIDRLHSV